MAITQDQLLKSCKDIIKIAQGLSTIYPISHLGDVVVNSNCRGCVRRAFIFLNLAHKDIAGSDMSDDDVCVYNFDGTDVIEKMQEIHNDMDIQVNRLISLYKSAFDTNVLPERKALFFTHLITAITALEEARAWLGINKAEILSAKSFKRARPEK